MVVVKLAPKPAKGVSILPTEDDILGLEVRIGIALRDGHFSNARFVAGQMQTIKAIGPVQKNRAPRSRRSQSDLLAAKAARAWLNGNGNGAKYWAQQSAVQKAAELRHARAH
jgi:hypothetical protein